MADLKNVMCHKHDFPYLEDYLRSLGANTVLYDHGHVFRDSKYTFIRRVPYGIRGEITFINTEQLSVHSKLKEFLSYVGERTTVYDYSFENIRISGIGTFLPYQEQPEETAQLKICLMQPKTHDFALIGTPSEHRTNIIDKLEKRGYTVCHVHGWNAERDRQVGTCRALLNIHYNEHYQMYESIRCDRWRFAGMKIFSEACIDNVEGVTFVDDFSTFQFDLAS
jgi:hypothetical protein